MAYPIDEKLVVAVASSALFDLTESDRVYQEQGLASYRKHQRAKENEVLHPGAAFPLARRLLRLNSNFSEEGAPVEIILLSRNDPDTGMRVMNSIEAHELHISRAVFANGRSPYRYMAPLNASLFLSANADDVRAAVSRGLPAGRVFPTGFSDEEDDMELRIAFDFDGVVADDSAETVYRESGPEAYQQSEAKLAKQPLDPGPLAKFFREIARLQRLEKQKQAEDPNYEPALRTAIVTARNAPVHKRVVATLRNWGGIEVDEVFFLGGIDKTRVLAEFKPHIFFDDQLDNIEGIAGVTPSAHVPCGVANEPSPKLIEEAYQQYEREKSKNSGHSQQSTS